jgi:hypothetical protein
VSLRISGRSRAGLSDAGSTSDKPRVYEKSDDSQRETNRDYDSCVHGSSLFSCGFGDCC